MAEADYFSHAKIQQTTKVLEASSKACPYHTWLRTPETDMQSHNLPWIDLSMEICSGSFTFENIIMETATFQPWSWLWKWLNTNSKTEAIKNKQEAQLPQRNSASAVHVCYRLANWSCNAQNTAESQMLYYFWPSNALIQEVLAENAFCHEIAAQGHSLCNHLPVDKG